MNRLTLRIYSLFVLIPILIATPVLGHPQGAKPAAGTTSTSSGVWVSAVGDLAGHQWGKFGVHYLSIFPDRDTLIAGVSERGFWSSVDGGATWAQLGEPGQMNFRPIQVTFDPTSSEIFWVTGIYGTGIYKTTNGGRSFDMLDKICGDGISVDFKDPDRRTLLTATHERNNALMLSVSSGRSWHSLEEGISPGLSLMPNAFIAPDGAIIAGSNSRTRSGIFRSADSGKSWQKVSPFVPAYTHPTFGAHAGTIFWNSAGAGIIRTDDYGKTWASLGGPGIVPVIELPNGILVSASSKRLVSTSDAGGTWRPFGPPIPFELTGLVYSPKRKAFYAWHMVSSKGDFDRTSIMRWTP